MKILFVWTGVTSYMVDCWRELVKCSNVELRIVIVRHVSGSEIDVKNMFEGLDIRLIDEETVIDLGQWQPDVVFAVGWHSRPVRALVTSENMKDVPKVCCFDMPWRWQLRCVLARWVLARYLSRFSAAFVPGESAARYARWLGFERVHKGLFSLDTTRFSTKRLGRGFMFVGRNAPEKRIDLIEQAYERYRKLGGTWNLDIYGGAGFVQPSKMPSLYANHACLLLASSFDPWPLVMLEATASGLMVIASDRCGNVDELRACKVKYGDCKAMAAAMLDAEHGCIQPAGVARAKDYDCRRWVERVIGICDEITGDPRND